ncbi:MAG: hypothetical protein ACLFUO_07040, partial [Candidatus Woesearchaeota archaeon]
MREFIYFSPSAATSGNYKDLMKAGRMDIVLHSIIASFFYSHGYRDDVRLHLIFYGQPDPPKHIEINMNADLEISKKDLSGLIKRILYKYKEGKRTEPFPGCFVEKKSFLKIVEEMHESGKEIFILDKKGHFIRDAKIHDNSVFVVGDHDGLPKAEMRRIKKIADKVSLGNITYFASQ